MIPASWRSPKWLTLAATAGLLALAAGGASGLALLAQGPAPSAAPRPAKTELGLNLFGLATFNRQQVFTNLIAQSEWLLDAGHGWTAMPPDQLDGDGWVRFLRSGQIATRPLVVPPAPFRRTMVRCVYQGRGALDSGGIARMVQRGAGSLTLAFEPTGAPEEGGWLELSETDQRDPLRAIDCRDEARPAGERFHPEFLAFLKGFRIIRFLDWQQTNDNPAIPWSRRTLPSSGSQAGPGGVSIEDMVDLANAAGADPWFLMPYRADPDYVRGFARLVHTRLDPELTVYVELGNEIWNDMFDAAQQAQREGLALGLGDGEPQRARMIRYADKLVPVMQIWSEVFADRPGKLVRVAASQNANPDLAEIILNHGDTVGFVDALATAPYIWLDQRHADQRSPDQIFAAMPKAIDQTLKFAERNRAIAASHGKRFLAYEGGQHLLIDNIPLARAVQRDPRMAGVYQRYLSAWRERIGGTLTLYASTAPIAGYGSWGLREYAGQPLEQTPKLLAVRRFLADGR
jgi:hypothetical protein